VPHAPSKGESVWDRFASLPGKIVNGHPASHAIHYHLYRKDLTLMRRLGFRIIACRSPARIFPHGRGALIVRGSISTSLIDAALEHRITPWVRLSLDLPQRWKTTGGWRPRHRGGVRHYARGVPHWGPGQNWITLNEIPCSSVSPIKRARWPRARASPIGRQPGISSRATSPWLAVRAVREHGGGGARVGLVHNPDPSRFLSPKLRAKSPARRMVERATGTSSPDFHRAVCSAICARPGRTAFGSTGDLKLIATPADFLGLNVTRLFHPRRPRR